MKRSVLSGLFLSVLLIGMFCGIAVAEPTPRETVAISNTSAAVAPTAPIAASEASAQAGTIRTDHFEIRYEDGARRTETGLMMSVLFNAVYERAKHTDRCVIFTVD